MSAVRRDVVIIGGGMVGLALAAALGGAGLSVDVIDREAPASATADRFDGRASAIAYGSGQVLRGIGLWDALEGHAQPILDIRVSDGDSALFLHYDHRELGEAPLGWIIENRFIRRALHALAPTLTSVRLHAPMGARLDRSDARRPRVALDDATTIEPRVVIACDGRNSPTRAVLGIEAAAWRYDQTAIVCAITHDRAHDGIAHERFLAAGPFAVLPLRDDESGRHQSSIVWTERAALAPAMLALDDAQFSAEIEQRFGPGLGPIRVNGRRWSYPLGLMHAVRYTAERVALAGDAAHAIHPIAGQGLNLGLRDVAALAECLVDAARLGLDIGADDVLARYERWRRFDNLVLVGVTDSLNRLFSNDVAPVRLARDLGIGLVNQAAPLKRLFMRHAMGVVGELPRLARGETL
jgi:2-octaprenyl-6-methoxyphenol hydroxylase